MANYPTWQPVIGFGREQTWGSVSGLVTGNLMPSGAPIGIPATEIPDFKTGVNTIESNKYHGKPFLRTDVSERMRGTKLPGTTLNIDVSTDLVVPFLMSLFQRDGSNVLQGGATGYLKTFRSYLTEPALDSKTAYMEPDNASSVVPLSFFLVKKTGATNEGHILQGCMLKSITISGAVNESIKASMEVLAKTMATNRDYSSDVFTFNTDPTILFQDMQFELGGTTTDITAFSFTINNNAYQKTYNNQTVQKIIYSKFDITGSITTPWDGTNTVLDAFGGAVDSNIQQLEWGNSATAITGSCSADRDFYTKIAGILKSYNETEQNGERMMEFSFEGCYDNSIMTSDQGSVEIKCCDSLQYANS